MITEARLILPNATNDGRELNAEHASLRLRLAETFGGFTAIKADGGWSGEGGFVSEPVTLYDIACEPSHETERKLRELAQWARMAAEQEAIYLRLPSMIVEFVQ